MSTPWICPPVEVRVPEPTGVCVGIETEAGVQVPVPCGPPGAPGGVKSVNGQTGDVVLDYASAAIFNGEGFVGAPAVTERVAGGTLLKNAVWANKCCASAGFAYDAGIIMIYCIFGSPIPKGGRAVTYAMGDRNSADPAYELTLENAPLKAALQANQYHKSRITFPGVVTTLDSRFCRVVFDRDDNEVERIYSAQYRYTITDGAVTREKVATEPTDPSHIVDIGLYTPLTSANRTVNAPVGSHPTLAPLVSTAQTNTWLFIVPDSAFEGANYGLTVCAESGDGKVYQGPTFDKAVEPVKSVNGQTGDVSLEIPANASDVGALPDDTKYAASPAVGGVASRASAIPFGKLDSTSTATVMTAQVPGITELKSGVCMWLMNGVVTGGSNFTLDVNSLGAKPVYQSQAAAGRVSSVFNVNYTALMIYNEDRVDGGCWDYVYGYDSNTNTIGYQIRTNSTTLPLSDQCYRYRLLFRSADGKKFVPANKDTQTSAAKSHTVNTTPIDPFGEIMCYQSTTALAAGAKPGKSTIWQQYVVTLGYSFNNANAALTLTADTPVYIRCTPQADGSALLDYFTQALPTANDGKIYIYLGVAVDATTVEVSMNHPVYYHDGTRLKLWT